MNWRVKSAIQRLCAALPAGSDLAYYQLQRRFGSFRNPPSPLFLLNDAVSFGRWLADVGLTIRGMRGLEVGTGRRLDLPFGLYLLGAGRLDTYDLNRLLKAELVEFSLGWMRRERAAVEALFLPAAADPDECRARLDRLLGAANAAEAMRMADIEYHAPADAARSGLPAGSVDIHYSYTVDEHIPEPVLCDILREAARVLAPSGVALHLIDPSDHFSHEDRSIPAIHFLRFTPAEWARHGGNKYAYHNRLRAHEHLAIFERCGFEVLRHEIRVDERSLAEIRDGFPLAEEFRRFTPEQLCGTLVRVLARCR